MEQPTVWAWIQFGVSIALLAYGLLVFAADRIPGLASTGTVLRKASWKLLLIVVDRVGGWLLRLYAMIGRAAWRLLVVLWRGPDPEADEEEPVKPSAPSVTAYVPLPALVPPTEPQTAPGLSGLSAPEVPHAPAAPAVVVPETLDTGSRKRAIALLLVDGWGTGQIRKVLVGDNGEIGRETAELRRLLGLFEDAPPPTAPYETPLARRPTAASFEREPV